MKRSVSDDRRGRLSGRRDAASLCGMHATHPRPLAFFVGAVLAGVLAVVALAETHSWWVLGAAIAMVILLGLGFEVDIWNASPTDDAPPEDRSPDEPAPAAPAAPASPDEPGPDYRGPDASRRVLVMTSEPVDADTLLAALKSDTGSAPHPAELGVMVVSPEGFGGVEITNDQGHYDAAQRAEAETVASLRRAGINAAGHVGEHDTDQAIADALALFPAERVVVFADGAARTFTT
jgi:hypothetical protein